MAALALATEAPTDTLLNRPPYKRDAPLITKRMWRNIIGQTVYQLAVLAVLVIYGADKIPFLECSADECDHTLRTTLIFNTFVFCQIFNEINSRKLGDGTPTYIYIVTALLMQYLPFVCRVKSLRWCFVEFHFCWYYDLHCSYAIHYSYIRWRIHGYYPIKCKPMALLHSDWCFMYPIW